MRKELIGEFLATFILIIFGCGSVGMAIILGWLTELYQVALFWGAGVFFGILATRSISSSHMNPSVTLAMCISKSLPVKKVVPYWSVQFLGALVAASVVYLLFKTNIEVYEISNNIVRGSVESSKVAAMFGEFFPNPGYADRVKISHFSAFAIEVVATFVLLSVIYLLDKVKQLNNTITAALISLTVSGLIIIVAPYTQACFNPARDFAPRLVAYFAGWGRAAFPEIYMGAFTVYILAPLTGASLSALLFRK